MESVKDLLKKTNDFNLNKRYENVLELLPDNLLIELNNADLWGVKAHAYWRLGRFIFCDYAIKRALKINPNQREANHYNDLFSSDENKFYDREKHLNYRYISSFNTLGNIYSDEGKFELAMNAYQMAIQISPSYPSPYQGIGAVYYKQKQYHKAIEFFESGIQLSPSSALYLNLSKCYIALNQFKSAQDACTHAKKIDNRVFEVYTLQAAIFQLQKNYLKAIEIFDEALKIHPHFAYYHFGKGLLFYRSKDYDQAINSYNLAIVGFKDHNDDKNLVQSYNGLGNVYYAQENWDLAINNFSESIKINSNEENWSFYNRGLCYYRKALRSSNNEKEPWTNSLIDFERALMENGLENGYYNNVTISKIDEIRKILNDSNFLTITKLVLEIRDMLEFKGEALTQFTSMSAAYNLILNESPFRLSEGAFLNDTSEGTELENFLEFIENEKKTSPQSLYVKPFIAKPFIASFVMPSKHNDLTLWRMYGKENRNEASGCAITIKRDEILDYFITLYTERLGTNISDENGETSKKMKLDEDPIFFKVAYINKDNNTFYIPEFSNPDLVRFNTVLNSLKFEVKKYQKENSEDTSKIKTLKEIISRITYLFKSNDYQNEQEIRLVVNGAAFSKVLDKSSSPPRVYIEVMKINSMISKITLGPKVEKAVEVASSFFYHLDKQGHYPEIFISHIPFK